MSDQILIPIQNILIAVGIMTVGLMLIALLMCLTVWAVTSYSDWDARRPLRRERQNLEKINRMRDKMTRTVNGN